MNPLKRSFDLVTALLLAPVAVIVCLLAAIPVAVESRASPFFIQRRVGRHERPFKLLKLRTMHVDAPQGGSHEIGRDKILRSGAILRRFKIDEFPQLWNVITGDMSLVGPRPGLPVQAELLAARRSFGVFELVPGITGISQVTGIDMSVPWELAASDARYLGPWRLGNDLSLLLSTAAGRGRGDAAGAA